MCRRDVPSAPPCAPSNPRTNRRRCVPKSTGQGRRLRSTTLSPAPWHPACPVPPACAQRDRTGAAIECMPCPAQCTACPAPVLSGGSPQQDEDGVGLEPALAMLPGVRAGWGAGTEEARLYRGLGVRLGAHATANSSALAVAAAAAAALRQSPRASIRLPIVVDKHFFTCPVKASCQVLASSAMPRPKLLLCHDPSSSSRRLHPYHGHPPCLCLAAARRS